MRVLVTGATGFLGSHVAEQLTKQGHQVRALVRPTSQTDWLEQLGIEWKVASLESGEGLAEGLDGADAIVHCAGLVKARNQQEFYETNVVGTQKLLDAALASPTKLRRFVLISSLAAHGPSPDGQPRTVDQPALPVTHYGRSKLAAEKVVLAKSTEIPVTVLRPCAIYGPRDKEIFAFFKSVSRHILPFFGLRHTLSIIHAHDCAAAVVAVLETEHPSGRIYFVDGGQIFVWKELGKIIQDALGVKAVLPVPVLLPFLWSAAIVSELYGKLRNQSVMLTRDKMQELRSKHWVCDSQPLRDELGWTPTLDFETGARETVRWYRQQGWL